MSKVVNIAKLIKSPSALTREQGMVVYDVIVSALKENSFITLDFGDVESIITPFLNIAIGKLYEDYDSNELSAHLEIIHIPDSANRKFQLVIDNAKIYYSDKKKFDKVVKEVMDV